ncbi:envelope stress response membrane protein PspB [Salinimonas marina]|uniref:Envelope stress response membrane protein PspB n=1 Tax=Salinimonas marina TaxID=2785918 RepID=A0A7S9E0S4_9ALTE|nr:envelope stress response membrane protein PspB [Salinimonas marina]QPG07218.1 envelope stress response membrane protein PspB [Salinimonas marina]
MDEAILGLLITPIILFMILVAPIWLILHYRSKKNINQGLSQEEHAALEELVKKADTMAERIKTLEAILDSEAPEWRNRA